MGIPCNPPRVASFSDILLKDSGATLRIGFFGSLQKDIRLSEPLHIAIIAPGYPSEDAAGFGFVHARVKLYLKAGHNVSVFVPGRSSGWEFEGVRVQGVSNVQLKEILLDLPVHVLGVHYPNLAVKQLCRGIDLPRVVWVHGHDVLWTMEISSKAKHPADWLKKRLLLIPRLIHQSITTGRFIRQSQVSVFVSEWMLRTAEKHAMGRFANGRVIPNPVDTELFSYHTPTDPTKVICLRSFTNNKYGIDTAIKAFAGEKDLTLAIFGKGRLYPRFYRLIKDSRSSARLHDASISHSSIPGLYHDYGIFVAPSRVEAQGVSMCEAMSAGLPVVATHVGGIPEFVRHGTDGYLVPPNDPEALIVALRKLAEDKNRFVEMSRNARQHMEEKCGGEVICQMEIEAFRNAMQMKK